MLSEAMQQTIRRLRAAKEAAQEAKKAALAAGLDPLVLQVQGIYAERRSGEEEARKRPLPQGLTVVPDWADGVPGEWLRHPASVQAPSAKVILFLHGGGFATGSALTRRPMAANLARRAHVDSFAIDYRLSPEYSHPAHLMDCVTAFIWLLKQGYAPQNIVVIGESAGAALALTLALYLKDHHLLTPGGVIPFSPVVDIDGRYDSHILRANRDPFIGDLYEEAEVPAILAAFKAAPPQVTPYCALEDLKSPWVSPIYGDFKGFPKLLIHVGTEEMLYDDSIELEKKAKADGADVKLHIWEGLFHCFPLFDTPEGDEACEETAEFIKSL